MVTRIHCPQALSPGVRVALPEVAAHHVARVLRLAVGDPLVLFDGRGGEWTARIERILKDEVHAGLERFDEVEREPPLAVTLVQALPAADKMDWIAQKCTELGVSAIRPVASKRSVIRLSGERMERRVRHWQGVVAAACEQCGRNRVPTVEPLLDLPQYLAQAAEDGGMKLLLVPESGFRLNALARPAGPVILLVGPEGGFDAGETAAARSAGFQPVSLGPRVLRAETAGMAAMASVMALWGDF